MRLLAILRGRRAGQRGTALLEAAISTVLLTVLMAGAAEGSQMLYTYISLGNVARQATRYAIVRGSQSGRAVAASDISTYVQAHAQIPNSSSITTTTTWVPNNMPGSLVKVQVECPFAGYLPFMKLNSVTLQSTSEMTIEQ
jgi:Flp pilus assembly protein TadG